MEQILSAQTISPLRALVSLANIVSGRSLDSVWPHSRYIGIIPGAVMNGIGGTRDDFPVFGEKHLEWQTTEYWSPHQATYLMCLCEMHDEYDLSTDIGVRTVASQLEP